MVGAKAAGHHGVPETSSESSKKKLSSAHVEVGQSSTYVEEKKGTRVKLIATTRPFICAIPTPNRN